MAARMRPEEAEERRLAVESLRKQIRVEGQLIALYEKEAAGTENSALRLVFRMIRLDCMKHIEMLQASIEVIEGTEVLSKDRGGIEENLRRHLELEQASLERAGRVLDYDWIRDRKGLAAVLEAWRDEEKRHHTLLRELAKKPFIPISGGEFAAAFRDDTWFEERYLQSKRYWEKKEPMEGTPPPG